MFARSKSKMERRLSLKLGGAFGALAIAATLATAAQAAESYKFGMALPITGRSALYGADQVKVAGWAVDEINKALNAAGTITHQSLEELRKHINDAPKYDTGKGFDVSRIDKLEGDLKTLGAIFV